MTEILESFFVVFLKKKLNFGENFCQDFWNYFFFQQKLGECSKKIRSKFIDFWVDLKRKLVVFGEIFVIITEFLV